MFRQEEILMGGWSDKTPEAMQKRRFEHSVKQLGRWGEPIGSAFAGCIGAQTGTELAGR